ncbi:hypothetical protein TRAPUB_3865 [Trametes pubescens]|uniref:Uncharacterized protein n=1 Tax=Trametes pubescens TaxID=154538 RepID=A0A1M2VCR8_TRAPU|nr:hypothetical protein TRAPUB_3865 [Trametes pubescens]
MAGLKIADDPSTCTRALIVDHDSSNESLRGAVDVVCSGAQRTDRDVRDARACCLRSQRVRG